MGKKNNGLHLLCFVLDQIQWTKLAKALSTKFSEYEVSCLWKPKASSGKLKSTATCIVLYTDTRSVDLIVTGD